MLLSLGNNSRQIDFSGIKGIGGDIGPQGIQGLTGNKGNEAILLHFIGFLKQYEPYHNEFVLQIGQRGDIEYGDIGEPGLPGRDGAPAPYGEKGERPISYAFALYNFKYIGCFIQI